MCLYISYMVHIVYHDLMTDFIISTNFYRIPILHRTHFSYKNVSQKIGPISAENQFSNA